MPRPEIPASPTALTLPSLPQLARRGIPQVVDALVPLGIFLAVNGLVGIGLAMLAGLGWSAFAILRRVARNRRVPALVIVAAALLSLRLAVVLATGSAFLYFLQPTIGTGLVALAFLTSVALRRPLSRRFAGDFLALPAHFLREHHVHRFFVRNSLMWAAVGLAQAGITYVLLVTLSSPTFAITQTALSIVVTVVTIGVSILWFRHTMGRHHRIVVATA